MAKLVEMNAVKDAIRNYGKAAIAAGRESLDAVDDILMLIRDIGQLPTVETEIYDTHWSNERAYKKGVKDLAERLCEGRVSNDPVVIAVKVELQEME